MKHTFEINKILVPIDFSTTSKQGMHHAVDLAKKMNADIHLLHVMNVSAEVFPFFANSIDITAIKRMVEEEMDLLKSECNKDESVVISAEIREGSIAKEIVSVAKSIKADLILMGTHGTSGFEEFFIGSNANRVITAASCPVLSFREGLDKMDFKRIALPIDSSSHTRDKVSEAAALAKVYDAEVYVVGLVTSAHEEEKRVFGLKIKQIEEYFDHQEIKYNSRLIHGEDIAEMTGNFAQTIGADLIVIMTEQEASTGLFVGPHAQRIVNHSRIPILSVTPLETFADESGLNSLRPFNS